MSSLAPASWIAAQQLLLGVRLLAGATDPDNAFRREVFAGRLWDTAELPQPSENKAYRTRLAEMPPATLAALCDLPDAAWGRWLVHKPNCEAAKSYQQLPQGKSMAPLAGAKLVADRLLSNTLTAPQLIRLARAELGARWENTPGLVPAMTALLNSLVNSDVYNEKRIASLHTFRATLGDNLPAHWGLVEGSVLDRSFAWPLLVLRTNAERSDWTLPIQIRVEIPSRLQRKPDLSVRITGRENIKCNWINSLGRARQAAIDLWLHKHGSWDSKFKDSVRQLSIEFNLGLAEIITEPFQENGIEIELDGRSLEAYMSLLVAGALVDRRGLESTRVTGIRSHRIPNGLGEAAQAEGADYWVDRPLLVEEKLRLVEEMPSVDKLLVPAGELKSVQIVERRGRKSLDVDYEPGSVLTESGKLEVYDQAQTFSDLADAAFGQKWRRHRYIRCPDLSAGFKRDPSCKEEDVQIGLVRDRLQTSRDAVLRLPEEISALAVAKALFECAQGAERRAAADEKKKDSEKEHFGPPQANTASFVFIRAVQGEYNERFWQTLWNVLDARAFDEFRFSLTSKPGEVLARQLNWLEPKSHRPQRAPDVIVIVGAKHLSGGSSRIASSPFRRLQLDVLEPDLVEHLKPCPTPALSPELGRTRIVVVSDDWALPVEHELSGVTAENLAAVRKLSVFRYGFSTRQAGRVLGLETGERDTLLKQLLRVGLLEKAAKRDTRQRAADRTATYDARASEFYLPIRLTLDALSEIDRAALHVAAAHSITGLVYRDNNRTDFREGLEPANLHEAQWHLQQAQALKPLGKRVALNTHPANVAGSALERLSRAGELFGWSRVRWAAAESNEDGREVLDGVEEHLKVHRAHPIELAWSAKLAHQLGKAKKLDRLDAERYSASYLDEAEANCKLMVDTAEPASSRHDLRQKRLEALSCEFVVRTTRACIQMDSQPNADGRTAAFSDIAAAREIEKTLKKAGGAIELTCPEWFEFCGDVSRTHEHSLFRYNQAIYNGNINPNGKVRYEAIIKYFGAATLARKPIPDVLYDLALNSSLKTANHFNKVRQLRSGLKEMGHVQERWLAGLTIFLSLAGGAEAHDQ